MYRLAFMIRPLRAVPKAVPRTLLRTPGMRFYSAEAAKETSKEASKEASKEEATPLSVEELNSKVAELQEKYNKKDKEYAELKDGYLRSVADFRNLQDTTKREILKARDFALQRFAKDLLESVDNFGHALGAVSEESKKAKDVKDLYDGFAMTSGIFEKTLGKHGIHKIEPIGEKFDPNQHEATFEVPNPDAKAGTVFHVQQPGYSLNGRVLRAAKVGVVKGDE